MTEFYDAFLRIRPSEQARRWSSAEDRGSAGQHFPNGAGRSGALLDSIVELASWRSATRCPEGATGPPPGAAEVRPAPGGPGAQGDFARTARDEAEAMVAGRRSTTSRHRLARLLRVAPGRRARVSCPGHRLWTTPLVGSFVLFSPTRRCLTSSSRRPFLNVDLEGCGPDTRARRFGQPPLSNDTRRRGLKSWNFDRMARADGPPLAPVALRFAEPTGLRRPSPMPRPLAREVLGMMPNCEARRFPSRFLALFILRCRAVGEQVGGLSWRLRGAGGACCPRM